MPQHDAVAPLGHDRQVLAPLVGPHAKAQEAGAGARADFLHLLEVATGFRAGLVQVFQRRAGQFQLTRRFQADSAVIPAHGDDMAAFLDRFPAEFAQRQQQVADTARFVIGRGVVVRRVEDQLFVFRADPPAVAGLFARRHGFCQLPDILDHRIVAICCLPRAHGQGR